MKKFLSITVSLFVLAMLIVPVVAVFADETTAAQAPVDPSDTIPDLNADKTYIENLMDSVVNWVFAVMITVGTIFVVLAALQFITGGGDPAKVGEARQKLIWAILGFAVAVLARAILPLVKSLLGFTA